MNEDPSDNIPAPPAEETPQESPVSDHPTDDSAWTDLFSILDQVRQQQEDLKEYFDRKIKYDSQKDETIKKLHDDVELYRRGIHLSILRPLVEDLLKVYDAMSAYSENYATYLEQALPINRKTSRKRTKTG